MSTDPVVILTALNVEYEAVRKRLSDPQVYWHPAGTRFETGRLGRHGCRAVLGLVGKGNQPAAVLTERAIAEFAPAAVLFVGVAGTLRPEIELGDVVIASQVHAYHGGTAEDDGLKARPRGWEVSHQAAAGVAQAGHLNRALPVVVVRGISDLADGSKAAADGQNWQARAAAHAAAFADALAQELVVHNRDGRRQQRESGLRTGTAVTFSNIATGNARVGAQFGQVNGTVAVGFDRTGPVEPATELAALRDLLSKAHQDGRLDDATIEDLS